jgi:hypothetical protein
MRTATAFIFVLCVLDAKLVWADEPPATAGPVVEVGVAASSAHVWRGFTIGDRTAVQPGVPAGLGGLTVTSWGNLWHAEVA